MQDGTCSFPSLEFTNPYFYVVKTVRSAALQKSVMIGANKRYVISSRFA